MEEYKAQYFTAILTLSKQKQIVEHELHPQKLIILKYNAIDVATRVAPGMINMMRRFLIEIKPVCVPPTEARCSYLS